MQPGKRRIRPGAVAGPRLRRRRPPRRPERARRARGRSNRCDYTGETRGQQVRRRRRRRDGPADGDRRAHRRARRGRAPAHRRHQRRHQGAGGAASPAASSARPISENAFAGLGGGHGPRRPVPPGRRVHVPRLHVGRRRPGVQPDRQGPAHVRRRTTRCRSCCGPRSRWAPGYGSQHLMDPAGIFATSPGWRIVAAVDRVPTTSA